MCHLSFHSLLTLLLVLALKRLQLLDLLCRGFECVRLDAIFGYEGLISGKEHFRVSVEAHEAVLVARPCDRVDEHGAEDEQAVQKVGPLQKPHVFVKPQIARQNPRPQHQHEKRAREDVAEPPLVRLVGVIGGKFGSAAQVRIHTQKDEEEENVEAEVGAAVPQLGARDVVHREAERVDGEKDELGEPEPAHVSGLGQAVQLDLLVDYLVLEAPLNADQGLDLDPVQRHQRQRKEEKEVGECDGDTRDPEKARLLV